MLLGCSSRKIKILEAKDPKSETFWKIRYWGLETF